MTEKPWKIAIMLLTVSTILLAFQPGGYMFEKLYTVERKGTGLPDFSAPAPTGQVSKPTIFTLSDMAELAARLGSIVTFDRRGDVIWLDDFEDNINKWFQVATGTGSSITLSTEAARNGAKSCKIVGPSGLVQSAYIRRMLGFTRPTKIGFEFSFADLESNTRLDLVIDYWDGENYYQNIIRLSPTDQTLQIFTEGANGFETLATGVNIGGPSPNRWYTHKLVVDQVNHKYVRYILNATEYDLSGYTSRKSSSTNPSIIWLNIQLTDVNLANQHVYIDDAIITQNEP